VRVDPVVPVRFGGVSRQCFLSVARSVEVVDDDATRYSQRDDTRPTAFQHD